MPKNKIILFCFLFSWIGLHPIAAISLEKTAIEQKILQAIQGKNATVGAAFSIDGQLFTFNDEHRYPLMSVFKLHVAIAALQKNGKRMYRSGLFTLHRIVANTQRHL